MFFEDFIFLSILLIICGDLIYVSILIKKKFYINNITSLSFQPSKERHDQYLKELKRITEKVNGWLYLIIFFNCIYYSFGTWAVIFPLLCFYSSSKEYVEYISFCTIFASISSSIMFFMNPVNKFKMSNNAWRKSSKILEDFFIQMPTYSDEKTFQRALVKLSKKINSISRKTNI